MASDYDSLAHVVEELIAGGAQVDADYDGGATGPGGTPLFNAAARGNAAVVARLIAACLADDGEDDITPLFMAAGEGCGRAFHTHFPRHVEPSFVELEGNLRRGEQYMPGL